MQNQAHELVPPQFADVGYELIRETIVILPIARVKIQKSNAVGDILNDHRIMANQTRIPQRGTNRHNFFLMHRDREQSSVSSTWFSSSFSVPSVRRQL
jgi:hypothetical protein